LLHMLGAGSKRDHRLSTGEHTRTPNVGPPKRDSVHEAVCWVCRKAVKTMTEITKNTPTTSSEHLKHYVHGFPACRINGLPDKIRLSEPAHIMCNYTLAGTDN
jgi:hypothetical protein